jgi:MYXO-CTERM domain-containing protein
VTGIGLIVVLALASWVLRAGFVVLVPASRMPAQARTALDHLPPSVLAALVAVDLTGSVGTSTGPGESAVVLGVGALLALAAWRTPQRRAGLPAGAARGGRHRPRAMVSESYEQRAELSQAPPSKRQRRAQT